MMMNSSIRMAKFLVLLSTLLVTACAGSSSYMRNVAPQRANYAPEAGKALVVFMRPSGLGFAIQSSVFDVTSGDPVFVGIVSAKTKLAFNAAPGSHRFMVVSESADFMAANLAAGKVYYATVTPRLGLWRARFSMKPVKGPVVGSNQFTSWYNGTRWVENSPASSGWANSNRASVRKKMAAKLPQWLQKANMPTLSPGDGQTGLYKAGS